MNYDAAFKNIKGLMNWIYLTFQQLLMPSMEASMRHKRSLAPPMKSKKLLQISRNIYIKKVLKDGDL
jgi:hypothetical protein